MYYFIFSGLREHVVQCLNYPIPHFWQVKLDFGQVGLPSCTTGIEFELSWSFLPNFAGTVKFVAKILVGMLSLCIFGLVQDWYCLIYSLVIWHSCVTCVFIANASYEAFI